VWGVPWLGLPLSGLLAVVAAAQTYWNDAPEMAPADAEAWLGAPPGTAEAQGTLRPRAADREDRLHPGETLGGIFLDLGLSPDQAHQAAIASARFLDLRQLRAGTPWEAFLTPTGALDRFALTVPDKGVLALVHGLGGWEPVWQEFRRQTRTRAIQGELSGSLEASVARAGALPELAYAMADVLQWDLDFTRDLRHGDQFRVLFEESWIEGYEPRPTRVLAVEYGQPGKPHLEAFWFGAGSGAGYFDRDGRPLQKAFLRSPLLFSRVTSRFSSSRFHPILGVFRPHYGVDYGAPVGTPVRSTASGTVISAGWAGGGGRTIKIQHPNGYLTAYLHLSKFAAGIASGARVRQGQVIGYVGATGLASGPHLDYRVQVRGRWVDPLSIRSVPAEPISKLRLNEFAAVRDAMRSTLLSGRDYVPPAVTVLRDASELAASTRRSPGEVGN
jgi:murein DD-endopeptidase MepM/ murein hydrolase activator NlpD